MPGRSYEHDRLPSDELRDAIYGTYTAPTTWLAMTSPDRLLYSEAVGRLLCELLGDSYIFGAHTHVFRNPPTEYDQDGEPMPSKTGPTLTIEHILWDIHRQARAFAVETVGRQLLYGTDVDPRLWDHNIDRCLVKTRRIAP